jgi:cytochrome c oxidase cbb3-type subunit III
MNRAFLVGLPFLVLLACQKEQRPFDQQPMSEAEKSLQVSQLAPGPEHAQASPVKNYYENNAWGMAEGKRLYEFYNCVGCHAHGGGGMGPPLMDMKWIYGSNPEQIFASIVEGRPNGMPSFRGKIPEEQVWQLVAYVRSLGGLTNTGAEPARDDQMQNKPPENSLPAQSPTSANPPKDHP